MLELGMRLKILSRTVFITILFLIIVNAHFVHNEFYSLVRTVGLDIPMTPFTADMTMMLSKKEGSKAYYKKDFYVSYKTFSAVKTIDGADLGWYEFKAPYQWFLECLEVSPDCPSSLYFLCRSLEDHTKSLIISWSIHEKNSKEQDREAGVGMEFRCPVK